MTLAPVAYLDLEAIRERAYKLFPYQSQWTAHTAWLALHASHAAGRAVTHGACVGQP